MTTLVHNDNYPAINPMKADLNGKRVLIVDTMGEFGRAMAISFAEVSASSIVISSDSDSTVLEKAITNAAQAAGRKARRIRSIETQVSSVGSIGNAAALVEATFAGVDTMIYNTTISGHAKLLTDSEPES